MPLTPLTGTLGKKRAAHLLRRACSGANPTQIDTFAAMTASEAFAALYRADLPTPTPPLHPGSSIDFITTATSDDDDTNYESLLNQWIIGQMLASGIPEEQKLAYAFRERIVFFMHTHFTTKKDKVANFKSIYYQNALFRHYAFDLEDVEVPVVNPDPESTEILPPIIQPKNFKHLTKKISVENAMLKFLDGRLNVKGSPNENYGRELLELYAIGRGLEGNVPEPEFQGDYTNYTEEDVQAAARVLSGFDTDDDLVTGFSNIDEETGLPRGVLKSVGGQHDIAPKIFSARLDNASIDYSQDLIDEGATVEELILDEISQLVDLVYTKEQAAKYVCRKLYRFFIYHQVTPELEASGVIADLAAVFSANEFKLAPVLEALFTSVEFYEGAADTEDDSFGCIIKSPLDLTVGFVKNFDIQVPNYNTEVSEFYTFMGDILSNMNAQGMDYYEPFEVAGYSAYHQFPIYNRSWITPNYLTNRYNFVRNKVNPSDLMDLGDINPLYFAQNYLSNEVARNAKSLIIAMIEYFLPMSEEVSFDVSTTSEITQERMNYFLLALLGTMDAEPETAWTENWDNQTDMEKADNQLANLMNAMFQTPEYQLM
ncbi:MAG: DUF1800 domain-containing protein [Reichenbachiella sp.]